jgi:hypothetical protein
MAARKRTVPQEAEERLAIFVRQILRIIFGLVYGNNFGCKLRHNKELYELLVGLG